MDFIKKHFEKILLALALLILIGVAVFLAVKISQLSNEVQGGGFRRQPPAKGIDKVATGIFTNTIVGLENPSLWHTNFDMFKTETQYVFVAPTNTNPAVPVEPFILKSVHFTPFLLKFMSYTGNGEDIGINFINKNRSYLNQKVGEEIKDDFGNTHYRILKFEHKEVTVHNPTLDKDQIIDVSELTIQHLNDNPIILVLGKVTNEKEPTALLLCIADNNKPHKVHKGDTITCGGKTYKVVDINSKQVIILDVETNEQHFIDLPDAKE